MSKVIADTLQGRAAGNEAPDFPKGATITGVTTSSGGFVGAVTGNVTGNATGLTGTPSVTVNLLTATDATVGGSATVTGQLSVGGTITYEDVTNIDSVGVITARTGFKVLAGGANIVGWTTCQDIRVGSNIKIGTAGVVTATSYEGSGANLTGIEAGISTEANTVSGGYVQIDLSKDDHKFEATGFTTVTCKGNAQGTEGGSGTIRITNSGICTVGFSTYFLWPSGAAPFVPIADGTVSLISYTIQKNGSVGIATQLLAGASVNFS